jgi:hypothetical protein
MYINIEENKDKYYSNFCNATEPGHTPMLTLGWSNDGTCVALNPSNALSTISKIQSFDGDDRIFCISSHDIALADVLDFFPKTANDWKAKEWREQGRWRHLAYFAPFIEAAKNDGK